jgi:dTDP-4-dehydrorhamnose reductase
MRRDKATTPPEVWGGVECTVNRVGDRFYDQIARSGHDHRLDDLDRFARLGIRSLRYPVLWERTAPTDLATADWSWADQRLNRIGELGLDPVVGLVHHGSGPRHTNLLDPAFPLLLAEYAEAVARRYPWITRYTPVNEPLTTARFSALYGHWYPHARDSQSFARALLHQCRGVVLAMERIRAVNPRAQLVQTDDIGKVFSTSLLAYQARFENNRRWLTFDLLCGKVWKDHPLWGYLRNDAGISVDELRFFVDHPCPPDLIGVNYYLTSERLLDERLALYPVSTHGGNGRHEYADVEAVRLRPEGLVGPQALLREVWRRYRIPIAITEVHNGCTREEQLRWLLEIWDAAVELRNDDVDLRAVTVWALLGAFDWNSLVTRIQQHYEPGAFDVRSSEPRLTALAHLTGELARAQPPSHPVLDMPGWWRRTKRLVYAHSFEGGVVRPSLPPAAARPILIAGASGTLGRAFARRCELRGLAYRLLSRAEMDIADRDSIDAAFAAHSPWAVVNAAGYVRVDDAEHERARCFRENTEGAALLANACAERRTSLVTFSSDLVFDGAKGAPYDESDCPAPLNTYGESKAAAESLVGAAHPGALIVRTSAFFGPWDEYNFVSRTLQALRAGEEWVAIDDAVVSPTYVPDLVDACLDLLIDGERGIWHLANDGAVTWFELACRAAELGGFDRGRIIARHVDELSLPAKRPRFSALRGGRAAIMPSLNHALTRYIEESGWRRAADQTETLLADRLEA